jgi:hypothetical protein
MSMQTSRQLTPQAHYAAQPWEAFRGPPARSSSGVGLSLLGLAGLVTVGLVVAAGIYFAPDIERYMKIRSM